jgi:K+-transporting ATPase ATPase B chain
MELVKTRKRMPIATLTDPRILGPAAGDAMRKLDPRLLVKNPVIFVTAVVAALATIIFIRDLTTGTGAPGFVGQMAVWLWITVLFANFAEAVAEGRGKAQADALRRTRTETMAKRLRGPTASAFETVSALDLKVGDVVLV